MFFGCLIFFLFFLIRYYHVFCISTSKRKETLSPRKKHGNLTLPRKRVNLCRRRTLFFAPLQASLTVEASIALPVFVICMAAVLQFGRVAETAGRLGNALCETAEQMAVYAGVSSYEDGNEAVLHGLSAVYARTQVLGRAGDTGSIKNENFLLSSFLREGEMIDLVLTYRVKALVGGVRIPGIFFIQRGSVRAWNGRSGSGGGNDGAEGTDTVQKVYVTEHGTVYHTDSNCSHIRLSIQQIAKGALDGMRNTYGEKYHACEKCGKAAGSSVYITTDGNRYHSSLECGGLKRTVKEVPLDELGNLRPCSKCGGSCKGG